MTQPPSPAERRPIVVVGTGTAGRSVGDALAAAGFTDFMTVDGDREVIGSVFDDDTDTWTLTTQERQIVRAGVVIATHPSPYVPWIPNIFGRNDFQGASFHAAHWDPDFDPAGKHIAVIGTDATAGSCIDRLTEAAASVTVFTHPPRRVVPEVPLPTTRARRWLRRHTLPAGPPAPAPALVRSAIEAVTSSGIRCDDGVEHRTDVIVFGTGLAIADGIADDALVGTRGITIRQAWQNGMEPYLGVAVRGFPNYFFITGPDISAMDIQATQARYAVECIALMKRTASTRIELRRSSQQVFNERAYLKPARAQRPASAFDLTSPAAQDDETCQTYDGAATLTIPGAEREVRVRLTGHLDPIDGHYHWQGTIFDPLTGDALKQARAATLTVGEHSAPARIVEQTPWGTHSVAGVGPPPYARSGR